MSKNWFVLLFFVALLYVVLLDTVLINNDEYLAISVCILDQAETLKVEVIYLLTLFDLIHNQT